jgi:tetratricopeptide (TPR) repeat protein
MINEGLQLCKEVVKLRKIKLGDDHPDTIGSIGNLAIAYLSTGQISEALPLYEENLKLSTAKLGTNHHYTLTAMNNLADAYSQAGQLEKAIVLHDQALRLMRVKLGPAHSLTVNSMNSLAEILATCNDPQIRDGARAVSLAEEAVAATQRKDGDLLDTLAAAYAETGRFAKAISTEKEAMALIKDPSNRKELEDRLKLYEANAPYRQPSR